jgi:hypothetical protein
MKSEIAFFFGERETENEILHKHAAFTMKSE